MIEMLGVLAIVGVLSVGGIAGYSKAMEKWKVNKMIGEYSMLIFNMKELHPNSEVKTGLIDVLQATQSVPENWQKINDMKIYDSFGNMLNIYSSSNKLVIDIFLGRNSLDNQSYSTQKCISIFNDLVYPLHNTLTAVRFYRSEFDKTWNNSTNEDTSFYGDAYCHSGKKCITDLNLTTINNLCQSCSQGQELCAIVLGFTS